jgi:hypothetical protein
VFSIWPHGDDELKSFVQHLGTQASINFTIGRENNGKLPFPNIVGDRNKKITITIYRKPTHIGLYLNYNSNHPKSTKQAIVTSFKNHAAVICSNKENQRKNINK